MPLRFETLKSRGDFKALSVYSVKWVTPGLIVLGSFLPAVTQDVQTGITLSRKVGNAVIRNKMRRRLKEIFKSFAREDTVRPGQYLIIGRKTGAKTEYAALEKELAWAMRHLYRLNDEKQ